MLPIKNKNYIGLIKQYKLLYFEHKISVNTLTNKTFYYTRCITPKRVTSLRCPSSRHSAMATYLLA